MDVFVTTSAFEGMPLTVVEAQMLGLPVVSSRWNGVGEVVADGRTGWTFPVGNVNRGAEAVLAVIRNDNDTATRIAAAARDEVFRRRSQPARMAQAYRAAYARAASIRSTC